MPVQIAVDGRNLNAFLSGEIDDHTAPALRERIDRAIVENKPQVLRLYFSAVSFMDSSGVGLVMGRYKQAAAFGGETEVFDLKPPAERIMKLSGLTRIVRFRKTPVTAQQAGGKHYGKNQ